MQNINFYSLKHQLLLAKTSTFTHEKMTFYTKKDDV